MGRFAGLERRSKKQIRQQLLNEASEWEVKAEVIKEYIATLYAMIDKYAD